MAPPILAKQATARKDPRFDYLDMLPAGVPAIEHPFWAEHPMDASGPGEATYYFPIQVMPKGPNATGVFFPAGFQFTPTINVIVYFHGHKGGKNDEFTTINQYWSGRIHELHLRQFLNSTGKQAVLIAPTLGRKPGSSVNEDMGIFQKPGAMDQFLREVRAWIGTYVPQYAKKGPEIGNIILAGHSGAGGLLLHQVTTMQSPVCEVWGFDSLYGWGTRKVKNKGRYVEEDIVLEEWLKSALSHQAIMGFPTYPDFVGVPIPSLVPGTRFYFYWVGLKDPVRGRSLQLKERARKLGLHNVEILESSKWLGTSEYSWENHFATVSLNFKARIAAASCL